MSKLQDKLRAVKVYNDYEFFGSQPFIAWRQNGGRSVLPPWYAVNKRGVNLGSAWYDDGAMTFSHSGGMDNKRETFNKASEFMRDRFGVNLPLARSPFGGWGDAEFIKRRIAELTGGRG